MPTKIINIVAAFTVFTGGFELYAWHGIQAVISAGIVVIIIAAMVISTLLA